MPKLGKRIILCLAHMSGNEQKYIKEAFDTNWVGPARRYHLRMSDCLTLLGRFAKC